jgi:hypothetical protein
MVFDEATLGKVRDSHVSHLDRFYFFKNTKRTPKKILNFLSLHPIIATLTPSLWGSWKCYGIKGQTDRWLGKVMMGYIRLG